MKTLFHIGYHKTGTSWLQQVYFPAHPSLRLVCDPYQPWEDPFLQSVIGLHDRKFDCHQSVNHLDRQVSAKGPWRQDDVPVISAERLSGHPYSGGYDSFWIAERIRACSKDALILCVVRNQVDMITSVYKQLVLEGYPACLKRWLESRHWKGAGFDYSLYEYDLLAKKYLSLFESERVCILPYELMCLDRPTFLKRICDFVGIPEIVAPSPDRIVHPSLPNRNLFLFRLLNHFRRSELNPFPLVTVSDRLVLAARSALHRSMRRCFSQDADLLGSHKRAEIETHYRDSNVRLQELVGWHFKDYVMHEPGSSQ
jgi:hypothetical protein